MKTYRKCSQCGKGRAAAWGSICSKCHKENMERSHNEARAVVATGKCPKCGAGLRRNLSMAGWWQCEQYGAEGFRKDSSKPDCSWQAFTE